MADQDNGGLDFKLNKPLPTTTETDWDYASIVNGVMAALALIPVLPLISMFCFITQFRGSDAQVDIFGEVVLLLTLLGGGCATCALPVLIPAGWVLSERRKQKTGKPYRWWSYILAAVLWLVFAVFMAFQLFGFPGLR